MVKVWIIKRQYLFDAAVREIEVRCLQFLSRRQIRHLMFNLLTGSNISS